MEYISIEAGRMVESLQGRDRGRCFVVLQVVDEQYVMMADGLTRKLNHQKKKKIKHLKAKPAMMEDLAERLSSHQLLDSDLQKALQAAGYAIDQPLCKEG